MSVREATGWVRKAVMILAAFAVVAIGQYLAPNTDYLLGVSTGIIAITLISMAKNG